MKLVYYITAHGYGHAVRSCAICQRFSKDVQLIFRTLIPEKFFKDELERPFSYFPGQFDCGCVQRDSVTVNKEETLENYMRVAEKNEARLRGEIDWVLKEGIDGIVSDIPPFAFEVARGAGISSVAATNFTWYDIYEPYAVHSPVFQPCLGKIKEQYAMADLLLELTPSTGMPYFRNRLEVSLVGGRGRNVRERLKSHFGLARGKYVGLIYLGEFGMGGASWKGLEKFEDWDFIGIYPMPGRPANYHRVGKEHFAYLDLIASSDVMISKLGYGIFAQALMNGTPLIYLPREDFAEYPVLHKAVREWGHGYCLPGEDYRSLKWEGVLHEVITRKRPQPQVSNGAGICAREIEKIIRENS
jgi:UDP:flavonoid glycosyltransferase YjiC (YdhE family)